MNPLEFIDMHLIIPSLLLLFGLFLLGITTQENSKGYFIKGTLILLMILNMVDPIYTASCAEENIKAFNSKNTLACKTVYDRYRISKKDGWKVDKSYFIKESLMIRADMCERE